MKSSKRKRCTTNEGSAVTTLLGLLPTDNCSKPTVDAVNDPIMSMKLTGTSSLRQNTNHNDSQLIRGLFVY